MANRFPLIFNSGAGQIQELAASDNLDLTSSNLVNAGILFTSSGSATAPSLQIGSGTTYNPGLYSPGTDQLAVATNGVQRLTIGSTGNIDIDSNTVFIDAVNNRASIGTSSPAVEFQVNAASDVNIALSNSSSVTSGNRGNIAMFNSAVSTVGLIRFTAVTDNVGTEIQFHTRPAAGSLTQSMTLDSTGRLAIGTLSPATDVLLTVGGTDTNCGIMLDRSSGDNCAIYNVGGELVFKNGSSSTVGGLSDRGRFDSSGRLLIGTVTARSNVYYDTVNFTPTIQLESSGSNYNAGLSLTQYSASGYGPILSFGQSSSNTAGTNTASLNGWPMGSILFNGNDGTNFRNGASIIANADGPASAGSTPGTLSFSTTPSGTVSPVERMKIKSNGDVSIVTGNLIIGTAGKGIDFSADGQAAGMTSELLDDYEEGTWTPTDGSGAGLSFTVAADARYTKIGRMVQCCAQITYPVTANTAQAQIGGLPFTNAVLTGAGYGAFTVFSDHGTLVLWVNGSGANGSVANTLAGVSVTNATISTKSFRLVWSYEAI